MLTMPGKIVELQLSIALVLATERRPGDGGRGVAPSLTELWRGSIALAEQSAQDARELAAFFEAHDGRVTPFAVQLRQGVATHANAHVGTLSTDAAAGAQTVSVALGAVAPVLAGTLLAFGTPGTAGYQVCEVLATTANAASHVVSVAPRLRWPLAAGTPVAGGDVLLPVTLASDAPTGAYSAFRGVHTLDVIEAP